MPGEILDTGDTVVALGHYHGSYKATGKVTAFQQYINTLQAARVTSETWPPRPGESRESKKAARGG